MPAIAQLLQQAAQQGLARIDAQLLMLHICKQANNNRAWLMAHDQEQLNPAQITHWEQVVQRRRSGEPVAYIVGHKEFYGLKLQVNPHVLDPRDDTETLVDWALELIPMDQPFRVLDLGTGSGAIALALQSQRPQALITATDASPQALAVAQTNAQTHQLKMRFILADTHNANWFSNLAGERFDLIVSNPPYIARSDPHLAALKHEPEMALSSGTEGLDAIRNITQHAPAHLNAGAWLLLEHGFEQAPAVAQLLSEWGFQAPQTRHDLAGQPRCTGACTAA